ncbi:hypothetical protein MKK88_00980 [Methylobacterium sp. E-005]|uniref:Pam3-gp28 family putative phage holin n=1 Tax=Methylobacterium sp. E-005 TaxID=2836549 RepID=UPI001FB8B0E8|nr:hypothetical protein [Methylobacterium sp. E-005]MCJ2084569.1 hypothetical protein [Methylobacterium sp. E-005]
MSDETPTPSAFEQATMSQATGTLKLILAAAGASLVQNGYLDQGSETEIASGIATLFVALAWVLWSRRKDGILKAASRVLGRDGAIITDQATANKLPSNVVSTMEEAEKVAPAIAHRARKQAAH